MSFAKSGFNPLAASGLSQLLGIAQSIVPEALGVPSGGYGVPAAYGYGPMQGGYGMPAAYGYGYTGLPTTVYTVTQTTYQQTYSGGYPVDPYGMANTMTMPAQAGWGGGYYPAYY